MMMMVDFVGLLVLNSTGKPAKIRGGEIRGGFGTRGSDQVSSYDPVCTATRNIDAVIRFNTKERDIF
jgi:hypothetical protein